MALDDPHFRLRVPADLKAKIEAAAKAAGRSMNAEIVLRLTESFAVPMGTIDATGMTLEEVKNTVLRLADGQDAIFNLVQSLSPVSPRVLAPKKKAS